MKPVQKVQAVVYDITDNTAYVLLLHRVLHWRGWEFPKGTMEAGESPEDTIKREVREETGLKGAVITDRLGKQIAFTSKGREYVIVDVFLIRADMTLPVQIDQNTQEHDGYRWVTAEEALDLLTYENARDLLKEVHRNLFK